MSEVPEYLTVSRFHPHVIRSVDSLNRIADIDSDLSIEAATAVTQRLVDCWNALAGLNPSGVAALIEAAENAVLEAPSEGDEPWLLALEAAIANIRGEQA